MSEFSFFSKTVCQKRPELCQPRPVKMVLFDADDTMWHIEPSVIASNLTGKLTRIDDDTVEVEEDFGSRKTEEYKPKKYKPKKHTITAAEYGAWWKSPPKETTSGPGVEEGDDLKEIQDELTHSLTDKQFRLLEEQAMLPPASKPQPKKDKPVYLEDIKGGWNAKQAVSVAILLEQYGKKGCWVSDVHGDGDLTVTCGEDRWVMTTDGTLFEEKAPAPKAPPLLPPPPVLDVTPVPLTTYKPRKITIKLLPTFRETIKNLEAQGIPMGIISLNSPGSVKRIVDAFGLGDKFFEVQDTWKNKGEVFADITARHKIAPWEALFVDNTNSHVLDVAAKCGFGLHLGKDSDVERPVDILKFIKNG